jgi:putative nucleotidyltransferase with HDIG domain
VCCHSSAGNVKASTQNPAEHLDIRMPTHNSHTRNALNGVETQLQQLIQQEEGAYHGDKFELTDSLWSHSLRVAALAEKIGMREGVDRTTSRLAGLFHDAGKFKNGSYHSGKLKEEDGSVRILYEMTRGTGMRAELIDQVAEAILQVYSRACELSLLAKILFDADNLDKLGLSGVGNFLIKAGLRGRGLNRTLLHRISVELTYARYAPEIMMTRTGRTLAAEKAPDTLDFFHRLLDSLRNDGLFDFHVDEVQHRGMVLDIVESTYCECGGSIKRQIWDAPDLKCEKIHVRHRCRLCERIHEFQFCRPLLCGE